MPATYEPIATTTLTSNTKPVTISSIPATYTDLRIVTTGAINVSTGGGNPDYYPILNGDSGANYSVTRIWSGPGTNGSTNATSLWGYDGSSTTSSQPVSWSIWEFLNYANTNVFKTVIQRQGTIDNSTVYQTSYTAQLWRSTSAINSITFNFQFNATGWIAGTKITLFGIKAA